MAEFEARDPAFEERVRENFATQTALALIGATLELVAPGEVVIAMPFREDLVQQHGFVHGGIITTIIDTACGLAAHTILPEGGKAISVEFKVNFLRPAAGERFTAIGKVIKAGKTLTVTQGEVYAWQDGGEKLIVTMTQTVMRLE